jgi:hypothetical protein
MAAQSRNVLRIYAGAKNGGTPAACPDGCSIENRFTDLRQVRKTVGLQPTVPWLLNREMFYGFATGA